MICGLATLFPEHMDSPVGFAKPSRSKGRIPGGRLIAGAGPRVGSGPCRRELDDGLWSSWPNFVILLYIFKESLKMKAERVAFCGFET